MTAVIQTHGLTKYYDGNRGVVGLRNAAVPPAEREVICLCRNDLVGFVVGKILDVLGVEHSLFDRWGEQ